MALVDTMHSDLIGEGKPFTEADYKFGLALSQIAPGPLSTQMASYFGWVAGGFWWSLAITVAFVMPSFMIVIALAQIYVNYDQTNWIHLLSVGTAPVVVALVIRSGWHLFEKTDFKRNSSKLLFALSFVVTVVYQQEVAWVFLLAALLPTFLRGRYKHWSLIPPALLFAPDWGKLWEIFKYFVEVGAFVFGSGLVIVPFLYGGVVTEHHWLTERQFIDAVAVGMMTPGPIVITVAFIGFLVAGYSGAAISALGMFLPCFLFVVIPAPFFKKLLAQHPDIHESVEGLSIAALGAIFGGAILLIQKNLQTLPQQIFAVFVLILAYKLKRVPDPLWIFSGFVFGYLLSVLS